MSELTITCPKCGTEIPLTKAVSERLRRELSAQFEAERSRLQAAIAKREARLAREKARLEERARTMEEQVARQVEAERRKLREAALKEAEERLRVELTDLRARLEEQGAKLRQAQEAELALRKKERELEAARESLELEVARRLDQERKRVAQEAAQRAAEQERLKLTEKEELIESLRRQIEELKQRAEQGSMQLQGEALELDLERALRRAFPADEIFEVKKGQHGADIQQRVRAGSGLDCGQILWEAKRARNWSPGWIQKLKDDQREARAECAVLVATALPPAVRGIGQVEGVWVCAPLFAPALASALRHGLIQAAVQRAQQSGREEKTHRLYDYLCSVEFRQRIEGIVEAFVKLQEQLAAEQRAFARQWKEREQQLRRAIEHTAMLYGGIQGIAGREALPEIRQLSLPGEED